MMPLPSVEFAVLFTLVTPLFAALFAVAVKHPGLREALVILTAAVLFLSVGNLLSIAWSSGLPSIPLLEFSPGLSLMLAIDSLGMILALTASFLWIVTAIYSIGYLRANNEKHQGRFHAFFAIALFATMGIAMAGNLLTLFLFYELLTLATYPLVVHSQTEEARRAGRMYLGILLATSIGLFLPAIVWTYALAGTLDFMPGGVLHGRTSPTITGMLLFLFAFGVGKAALMPVHRWLPVAMVAPIPVSALLHAVAVVKAGAFTLLKIIVYIFGIDHLSALGAGEWLVCVAGISMIGASLVTLRQEKLKLLLAYSTISQLSCIVMAAAVLSTWSIVAAAFYIAAHAVAKITLFFAAGAIATASGKTRVSQLDGIGRRMPWTMGAFAVGAFSMIGIPPAAGFLAKLYLFSGTFGAQQWFVIAMLILSTVLNALYFLPVLYRAFFAAPGKRAAMQHGEAPLSMVLAMSITAALTIGLFFYPALFLWLGSLAVS